MKYFHIALFLVLFGNITLAGVPSKDAIYLSVQPEDKGLGIRYDHYIGRIGLYMSGAKGAYKFYDGGYIKDHYRFASGLMWQFPQKLKNPYIKDYLILGVSYHLYGTREYNPFLINEKVFKPLSFEAGAGLKLFKFAFGIRMDILKWEGIVDFGIRF